MIKQVGYAILIMATASCGAKLEDRDGTFSPEKADPALARISQAVRETDSAYRSVAAIGGITTVRGGVSSGDPAVPADVPEGISSGGTDPTPPHTVLPPHAVQPVTITWNGELEPLLMNIAQRGGYTFRSSGQRPPAPMVVSIVADEEPLFGVVRRAGMMTTGYADISFDPASRVIELHYRG